MKKPTKSEIERVAKGLLGVFFQSNAPKTWRLSMWKDEWRRVAEYVLTNYTKSDDYKMPPYMGEASWQAALKRRRAYRASLKRAPKSCKLVRGKVVCK